MKIAKYEYSALTFWNARLHVRYRLMIHDDQSPNSTNYRHGTYRNSAGSEIGFVDLSAEALIVFKHIPIKGGGKPNEVWIPPRRLYDLQEMFQNVYDEVSSGEPPCFTRYADGSVFPSKHGSELSWDVYDLPLKRAMRVILGSYQPDPNTISQTGITLQVENAEAASTLSWNDFLSLKRFTDTTQPDLITLQMMNMLYYENLLHALRNR